jgi:hypothetical protein
MSASRPHMALGIDQLRKLATGPMSNADTVKAVLEELQHRNRPKARRLRQELLDMARLPSRSVNRANSNTKTSAPAMPKSSGKERPPLKARMSIPAQVAPIHRSNEALMSSLLRATFSEASEVLSRWGMTEEAPQGLRELAFEWWRLRLHEHPDSFGRTLGGLEADIAYLRKARGPSHLSAREPAHADSGDTRRLKGMKGRTV